MGSGENNQVPIPNGGEAEFHWRVDFKGDIAFPVLNRPFPALLQRQERVIARGIAPVVI
jgi:hypothetical protein